MVEYKCDRCGKIFTHKSTHVKHINRKKKCDIVDRSDLKLNMLIKKLEEMSEIINESKNENKLLKDEIEKLKKQQNNVYNGELNNCKIDNSSNSSNLYILNVNAFGKENDKFIDTMTAKKIMNRGYQSIPEYIKMLHFNKDKLENHNIYLPNWRDNKRVLVYDGKKWNLENKNSIIEDLKSKGIDFIQKNYKELNKNDKNDAAILKKIDRFLESYNDEEKDKMDALDEDITLVLYNNRHIIEKTRKTQID